MEVKEAVVSESIETLEKKVIQKNEEMSIVYFEKINYFLRKGII